jgi:hypothetical protein
MPHATNETAMSYPLMLSVKELKLMTEVLSHERFQDEQAAYDWVEAHRWPHGPECPVAVVWIV